MVQNSRLFAAYVEITQERNDGNRCRKQWLVLPPLPADLCPPGTEAHQNFLYFYREQKTQRNRSKWNHSFDTTGILPRDLSERVKRYVHAGWKASPVITCEVHPNELAMLIREPKTPYRVLERIERVAKAKHNLAL